MYVGRGQLDTAFIDRFALRTIDVDYDTTLEAALCPNEELLATLHRWREGIMVNKLRRVLSTRSIHRIYRDSLSFPEGNYPESDLIEEFFLGWPEDERNLVTSHVLGQGVEEDE